MWIAFVLWKIDICYNINAGSICVTYVVNCFCSLKDWYLLQLWWWFYDSSEGCELLLFFERLIFATTANRSWTVSASLWIAFVLWKIDICYNPSFSIAPLMPVVNCFCSLKDWYLLQHTLSQSPIFQLFTTHLWIANFL